MAQFVPFAQRGGLKRQGTRGDRVETVEAPYPIRAPIIDIKRICVIMILIKVNDRRPAIARAQGAKIARLTQISKNREMDSFWRLRF